MVTDPVCGRQIDPAHTDRPTGVVRGGAPEVDPGRGTKAYVDGTWIYFCSLECRRRYSARGESA